MSFFCYNTYMYKRIYLGKEYILKDEKSKQNFDFLIKKMEGFHKVILEKVNIAKELNLTSDLLIEAKMIYLFSILELIFGVLYIYDDEKMETKEGFLKNIKDAKNSNYKKELSNYINNYLLNNKNKIYKDNYDVLKRWNGKELLNLRNHLSHFISIPSNIVIGNNEAKDIKEIKKIIEENGSFKLITPEIFFNLLEASFGLILHKIVEDYFNGDKKNRKKVRKKLDRISNIFSKSTGNFLIL